MAPEFQEKLRGLEFDRELEIQAARIRVFKASLRTRDWDTASEILTSIKFEHGKKLADAFLVKHVGDMIEEEGFSFVDEEIEQDFD